MMIGGGGVSPQHRLSAQRWVDGINLWPNDMLAFNHPSGEPAVCLEFPGFLKILLRNVFKNKKN